MIKRILSPAIRRLAPALRDGEPQRVAAAATGALHKTAPLKTPKDGGSGPLDVVIAEVRPEEVPPVTLAEIIPRGRFGTAFYGFEQRFGKPKSNAEDLER